ncbi:MAG: methyltransferase domain-containing protein [Bacteroidota bacterium]
MSDIPILSPREIFDRFAEAYQERYADQSANEASLTVFCKALPGSKVLEIGCGPGTLTKYLLDQQADLELLGIDLAPNMVRLARQNFPTATFEVMDCREMVNLPATYHGILCGFVLPYLSREEAIQLIADATAISEPGAVIYFSTIEGAYADSGIRYASNKQSGAHIYLHEAGYLKEALDSTGWEVIHEARHPPELSFSGTESELILIARQTPD